MLRMDETGVQVMREEGCKDTQKSYIWLTRGGPLGKPVVIFKYSSSRKAENINEFIDGFRWYLQSDGYVGYDSAVTGRSDITYVECFAHGQRKFFQAQKGGGRVESAAVGIRYIKELYDIDNKLREWLKGNRSGENNFITERKEYSAVILEKYRKYLEKRSREVPGETLLGKAVSYTLNQWENLQSVLSARSLLWTTTSVKTQYVRL